MSRRSLLASVCSVLLSEAVESRSSFGEVPRPLNSGRINLTLNGLTYDQGFYPFLNAWKSGAPIHVTKGDESYWSNYPPGLAKSAWGILLDKNGELVKPLPADTTQMERVFYSSPQDGLPEGFNRIGEKWILKWEGSAKVVSVMPALAQLRVNNRIEWVWGINEGEQRVIFDGIDVNDPPRNVLLCEARHEALVDAGEVFNPDWLAKVQEGSGIVRFMGLQSTNNDVSTLHFRNIPDESYFTYGGDAGIPRIVGGLPVTVMSALANKVQSHPWVCIPHVFGTKKLTAITNVTQAEPAVVTSPGHNWENGEKALIYRASGKSRLNQNVYTVENSDPKSGTLELTGIDSTGFDTHTSSGFLASPYDLDDIAAEVKLLATHFRDRLDPRLICYFELSNETWNTNFDQFHWFTAQGKQLYGADGFGVTSKYFI